MEEKITVGECSSEMDLLCHGCRREFEYEEDGIGCEIQLKAQFDGIRPDEWQGGTCSKREEA